MKRQGFVKMIDARGYRVAAEIGVAWGAFSTQLLQSRLETLYCVDSWAQRTRKRGRQPWGTRFSMAKAIEVLKPFGNRAVILRSESADAAHLLKDVGLDFVYIDATHSYEAVKRDIELWWPLVKRGGVLAGHDYSPEAHRCCNGVIRAVDQFVAGNKLELNLTSGDYPEIMESWWVNK